MSYVPPPPPPPPAPQPQWGVPGAPGTPGPTAYAPVRTEGTAVAALVLSIVSWVLCPIIAAVVALVLAHVAGNKIDASGGRLTGDGLVKAAQIIAWIHIVLFTLVMVGAATALVAIDRVAEAEHWPSDVLAGLLYGGAILAFAGWLKGRLRRRQRELALVPVDPADPPSMVIVPTESFQTAIPL
jgi:hypothetical protein